MHGAMRHLFLAHGADGLCDGGSRLKVMAAHAFGSGRGRLVAQVLLLRGGELGLHSPLDVLARGGVVGLAVPRVNRVRAERFGLSEVLLLHHDLELGLCILEDVALHAARRRDLVRLDDAIAVLVDQGVVQVWLQDVELGDRVATDKLALLGVDRGGGLVHFATLDGVVLVGDHLRLWVRVALEVAVAVQDVRHLLRARVELGEPTLFFGVDVNPRKRARVVVVDHARRLARGAEDLLVGREQVRRFERAVARGLVGAVVLLKDGASVARVHVVAVARLDGLVGRAHRIVGVAVLAREHVARRPERALVVGRVLRARVVRGDRALEVAARLVVAVAQGAPCVRRAAHGRRLLKARGEGAAADLDGGLAGRPFLECEEELLRPLLAGRVLHLVPEDDVIHLVAHLRHILGSGARVGMEGVDLRRRRTGRARELLVLQHRGAVLVAALEVVAEDDHVDVGDTRVARLARHGLHATHEVRRVGKEDLVRRQTGRAVELGLVDVGHRAAAVRDRGAARLLALLQQRGVGGQVAHTERLPVALGVGAAEHDCLDRACSMLQRQDGKRVGSRAALGAEVEVLGRKVVLHDVRRPVDLPAGPGDRAIRVGRQRRGSAHVAGGAGENMAALEARLRASGAVLHLLEGLVRRGGRVLQRRGAPTLGPAVPHGRLLERRVRGVNTRRSEEEWRRLQVLHVLIGAVARAVLVVAEDDHVHVG